MASESSPSHSYSSGCALILPGAVAKGGYEAGVISVLAEQEVKIDRLVGTSSGALNAVAYAAGIRIGKEKEAAEKLKKAWVELGSWQDSFHFAPWQWLRRRGLSDQKGLYNLLRELVLPAGSQAVNDLELRIIVASLDGIRGSIGKSSATTYEKVFEFCGEDFDTQEGLERIFEVTVAACSFPILFVPSKITGVGDCFDGGTVNNTPIQYALDSGDINHIIVPIAFPILGAPPKSDHGLDLLNHSVEILINERLFRDLKNAYDLNDKVDALNNLVVNKVLTTEQLGAVKSILPYRKVRITQIRPEKPIGGGVFLGFIDQKLRQHFIAEGVTAAINASPINEHPVVDQSVPEINAKKLD